jgi:predicted aspartyl protease
MPAYDGARFQPPAPVATVTVSNPATGTAGADVPMLLDTGADVSLVPEAVVRQIGVAPIPGRQYQLVAFDGSMSLASVVQLELVFCRRTFRGQFLLTEQDSGILGRNVLNALSLLLDGPRLLWDEYRPPSP